MEPKKEQKPLFDDQGRLQGKKAILYVAALPLLAVPATVALLASPFYAAWRAIRKKD